MLEIDIISIPTTFIMVLALLACYRSETYALRNARTMKRLKMYLRLEEPFIARGRHAESIRELAAIINVASIVLFVIVPLPVTMFYALMALIVIYSLLLFVERTYVMSSQFILTLLMCKTLMLLLIPATLLGVRLGLL